MKVAKNVIITAIGFVLTVPGFLAFGQKYPASYYDKINAEIFKPALLSEIILAEFNRYRADEGMEPFARHEVLDKAADDQAMFMASQDEVSLKNRGNKKTTADRVILYGGTRYVEEIVLKANIKTGKEERTYFEVAEELVKKWIAKKKDNALIMNNKYIFNGIGAVVDYEGKKVYVSVVFGNHYSFSAGARLRNSMEVPYTTKRFGLKPYDEKLCRRCKKFPNIEDLYEAMYVKDNKIYFHYKENIRAFKKLMKEGKDGLTVDIVQKSQYNCRTDNIVDYNQVNKGIMLKPMYSKAIYKKNMIPGEKVKEVMVVLGEIPAEINGDYEVNLLVVQNKRVCRTITKSFIEVGKVDYFNPLELIPDTVTIPTDVYYKPIPDTNNLYFTIPFEKGKYEYKREDIEPLIAALDKPDFIILELKISAFSSIEGTDETNLMLQQKRAESIVDALKKRQQGNFISKVETGYAWENFKNDILSTKYAFLAEYTLEDAKSYIVSKNLLKELEPILAQHRYASIDMRVTYNIAGPNEQAFVVDKFNRTITAEDIPFAFSIQKYIVDKVVKRIYNEAAARKMNIPEGKEYAPFHINKIFMEKISTKNKLNEDYCDRINILHQYSPENPYILYNKTYCEIFLNDFVDKAQVDKIQNTIESLYNVKIDKELVDLLNLDYQFKVIKLLDTTETPSPQVVKAFNRIKSIVKLDETHWQNAHELAQLFVKYKDYNFALKLLEPYIEHADINEEFVFTYISLCSYFPNKLMSNRFAQALRKASEMNPSRYCDLFKGDKFSFQVLDNPFVKDFYCKTCEK